MRRIRYRDAVDTTFSVVSSSARIKNILSPIGAAAITVSYGKAAAFLVVTLCAAVLYAGAYAAGYPCGHAGGSLLNLTFQNMGAGPEYGSFIVPSPLLGFPGCSTRNYSCSNDSVLYEQILCTENIGNRGGSNFTDAFHRESDKAFIRKRSFSGQYTQALPGSFRFRLHLCRG